jgi:hypothetical protein
MSHHGSNPFEEAGDVPEFERLHKLMRDLLNTTGFRGAVGSYPDGVLRKGDSGLIQFAIGEQDGKVVIDFGTPVAWMGMTPQQAADFASSLLRKAREVGRKNGETITLTIGG